MSEKNRYEIPSRKEPNYIPPTAKKKEPKRKNKLIRNIQAIIVVIILIMGGYYLYLYYQNDTPNKSENSNVGTSENEVPSKKLTFNDDGSVSVEEDLFVTELNKEGKKLITNEENWDRNRVERDGEHRTNIRDKKIGQIDIDRIRLHEPIYAGASELNLRRGSATVDFKEPLTEQTTAIAGHVAGRYEDFTEIKQLVKGDIIKVKDYKTKKTATYKVDINYTVKPTQREVLLDSKKRKARKLVLITCHNYDSEKHLFKERWIVEAYEI